MSIKDQAFYIRIALMSDSEIKKEAVNRVVSKFYRGWSLSTFKINDPENQVEQPIGEGGLAAAENRLSLALKEKLEDEYHVIIVMENYISKETLEDRICVILYVSLTKQKIIGDTFCAKIGDVDLFEQMLRDYHTHKWGCTKTYGELLHQRNNIIPKNDWMSVTSSTPRVDKLEEALKDVFEKLISQLNT